MFGSVVPHPPINSLLRIISSGFSVEFSQLRNMGDNGRDAINLLTIPHGGAILRVTGNTSQMRIKALVYNGSHVMLFMIAAIQQRSVLELCVLELKTENP